jgi:hypothetical protein
MQRRESGDLRVKRGSNYPPAVPTLARDDPREARSYPPWTLGEGRRALNRSQEDEDDAEWGRSFVEMCASARRIPFCSSMKATALCGVPLRSASGSRSSSYVSTSTERNSRRSHAGPRRARRLRCGGRSRVRPASVTVVGPAWTLMRLSRMEQAPSVCSASPRATESERWSAVLRFVERFGMSVGYAAARGPAGTVVAGPGLAAGFRLWP